MKITHLSALAAAIFGASAALKADNFIIDLKQVKDFELLLGSNQTLIVDYRSGELLGILETLENGEYKRLEIPPQWQDKDIRNAFRLKNYSDYNAQKSQIGGSSHTDYERNAEFENLPHANDEKSEFELMQEGKAGEVDSQKALDSEIDSQADSETDAETDSQKNLDFEMDSETTPKISESSENADAPAKADSDKLEETFLMHKE